MDRKALVSRLAERSRTGLREILMERDIDYAELLSCMAAYLWSLVHLVFWPAREALVSGRFAMHEVAFVQQTGWAILLVLIGSFQFISLVLRRWKWRRRAAMIGAATWAFLFSDLFLGDHRAMLPYMCLLVAFSEAWAYWRLRRVKP